MDPIFLQGIGWVFGLAFLVLIVAIVISAKKDKKANVLDESLFEQPFETNSFQAEVIDMQCSTEVVGIKNPKNVRSFLVIFKLENNNILPLSVNEEQYDGFEVGQCGLLTTVDGELYSFEL